MASSATTSRAKRVSVAIGLCALLVYTGLRMAWPVSRSSASRLDESEAKAILRSMGIESSVMPSSLLAWYSDDSKGYWISVKCVWPGTANADLPKWMNTANSAPDSEAGHLSSPPGNDGEKMWAALPLRQGDRLYALHSVPQSSMPQDRWALVRAQQETLTVYYHEEGGKADLTVGIGQSMRQGETGSGLLVPRDRWYMRSWP